MGETGWNVQLFDVNKKSVVVWVATFTNRTDMLSDLLKNIKVWIV